MAELRAHQLLSLSDDEVFQALATELTSRLPSRTSPEFLGAIQQLPQGLRAMAATYELDVSLCLDDFGWHFGNWHDPDLADETARGLEELGAADLARLFREAFRVARDFWRELGSETWMQWYHGSEFEVAMMPLNEEAWQILSDRRNGIFSYWVEYARSHPEKCGAQPDA